MKSLIILASILFSFTTFGKTFHPSTIEDFKKTSVRIYNLEMNSGGTGSIYRSYSNASHILTNKHVCELTVNGGYVVQNNKKYLVTHYKKFAHHDLCLVRIAKNLGVSLKVARTIEDASKVVYVSGHPSLLPHILTKGHLSDRVEIELLSEIKPCTKEDFTTRGMECIFFGGIPVLKKMDAQVVSNLIKPGSSGSPVFNKNGEIIGLVYASDSREASFGYIVPQIYLFYFLQNAHRHTWQKVGTLTSSNIDKKEKAVAKCSYTTLIKNDNIRSICKRIKDSMIWRKYD